jgi:hypothetical protein
MLIAGIYSFNDGEAVMKSEYPSELEEVRQIVQHVDSQSCKTKLSREKTKRNQMLYSPSCLNKAFRKEFTKYQWRSHRISCDYPTQYYVPGYTPSRTSKQAFREIDFVKNQAGVEVQFGKYAFMVYNVCAKMTIFHNESVIEVGIEIVPVKEFALQMSTGVSYFEQFVWDLEHRGVSNIDIPVLILGVADH